MDFLKKHYEKILLGVVLLLLAVAVVALPFYISSQKEELTKKREKIVQATVKPLPLLDDTRFVGVLHRLETPAPLNLSRPHYLFNPLPWQRKPDGTLLKLQEGNEVGPDALAVVKISPLYTTVRFESVGSASNYLVSITREAEPDKRKRQKKSFYIESGVKNEFLTLVAADLAGEKPILTLAMGDTGEKFTVSPDRPYPRVDGYTVDFRYDPEKASWAGKRVDDKLAFGGDEYPIMAINLIAPNRFEVVLSSKATGKKTTIKFNAE